VSTFTRILRNTLIVSIAQVLTKVLTFAYVAVITRFLDPEQFGEYSTILTLITFFTVAADSGLTTLTTRDVARDRTLSSSYLANGLLARLILSIASYGGMILVGWFLGYPISLLKLIALAGLSLLPSCVIGAYTAIFTAHERMEIVSLFLLLLAVSTSGIGTLFLLMGLGLHGVLLAVILANMLNLGCAVWIAGTQLSGLSYKGIRIRELGHFARAGIPFTIRALLSVVYFRIDILLLSKLTSFTEVGIYQAAYKILDLFLLFPGVLNFALFPLQSGLHIQSREKLRFVFEKHGQYLLAFGMPAILTLAWFAPEVVRLIYGPSYGGAASILTILAAAILLMYINAPIGNLVISSDLQTCVTAFSILTAASNVALNLLLIPHFGASGAAFATIGSELASTAIFYTMVRIYLGPTAFWRNVGKILMAGLLSAGLAGLLSHISIVIVPLALSAYIFILIKLHILSLDERQFLTEASRQLQIRLRTNRSI